MQYLHVFICFLYFGLTSVALAQDFQKGFAAYEQGDFGNGPRGMDPSG